MKHNSLSLLPTLALLVMAPSWGQQAPAGAAPGQPAAAPRDVPRPDELEPRVDTSATPPSDTPGNTVGAGAQAAPNTPAPAPRAKGNAKAAASASSGAAAPSSPGVSAAGDTRATQDAGSQPGGAQRGAAPPAAAKAGGGKGQDRIELDTTQITGNRELPKVLYIVPWKRSDLGDLVGKPPNSLLDEVLAPVDRDVFKRENRYYDALKPDAARTDAGSPAGR